MDVSLTKDLEEYITNQVKSGFYTSASEVIREALRNQIKSSLLAKIDQHISSGRQDVENEDFHYADDAYFDEARQYIKKQYIRKTD